MEEKLAKKIYSIYISCSTFCTYDKSLNNLGYSIGTILRTCCKPQLKKHFHLIFHFSFIFHPLFSITFGESWNIVLNTINLSIPKYKYFLKSSKFVFLFLIVKYNIEIELKYEFEKQNLLYFC